MNKIIMLGTGNGGTIDLYNTCFVVQNENGNFLIDTGGSIEILRRLEQSNIDYKTINNIFISHSHTDHILGLFWFFKKISRLIMRNQITDEINIYCNDVVCDSIKGVAKYILPDKLMNAVYSKVNFVVLNNKDTYNINGIDYEFFDICARGTKQFGFKTQLNNKTLTFLGDETLNPKINDIVKYSDYVMHEAFCLESEENIFHAYEKHHSTVKHACEIMNELDIKNLILYHTEESHGNDKKSLYETEGIKYFDGNVIVPADMEEINII